MDQQRDIETLASDVRDLRAELGALTERTRRVTRPWYQQAPVLISALSFAFTIITAGISGGTAIYNARTQELAQDHASLRNLVQQILFLENQLQIGTSVNALYLTAEQAKLIVKRIDALDPGSVSAPEYNAISSAFVITRNLDDAVVYADKAMAKADTLLDDLAARRGKASALVYLERYAEGDALYAAALSSAPDSPFVKYRRLNDKALLIGGDGFTYASWAQSLFNMNQCDEAERMLAGAIAFQQAVNPSNDRDNVALQLTANTKAGTLCQN